MPHVLEGNRAVLAVIAKRLDKTSMRSQHPVDFGLELDVPAAKFCVAASPWRLGNTIRRYELNNPGDTTCNQFPFSIATGVFYAPPF
jgi:hypothetical protein